MALTALALPFPFLSLTHTPAMKNQSPFDVIIIGGSYAGLSAGLALGRALRRVLIIDSGKPCNRQTPHSHNFLTHDGETPKAIWEKARAQVEKYDTITFYNGLATTGTKTETDFSITTEHGDTFLATKLLFASGISDQMPKISGFADCWGISVIHCPYCHGYEVRNEATGILYNGDMALEFSKLINHWTKDLTLFSNGPTTLTPEQQQKLESHQIRLVEKEVEAIEHHKGYLSHVVFKDGSKLAFKALYAKIPFVQHSEIPAQLGCELNEHGFIKADAFQKTTVPGIYVCGDSCTMMRSVSNAVATGTMAGAMLNKELIDEEG